MLDGVVRTFKIFGLICFIVAILSGIYAAISDDADSTPQKAREVVNERIDATLGADGTLHVVDARTYKFTGSFTLIGEILDPPPSGTYQVNGVSVVSSDGTRTELEQVDFDEEWRYAGGAGDGHYALDKEEDSIYAFTDSSDEEKTIVFDYSYTGMVDVYKDCAILYWQFVPRGRGEAARDVQTTLTLPVPANQSVKAAENVYAWGHCELGGDVSFNDDGTIAFNAPKTEPGVFAEMRVAYPPSWAAGIKQASLVHDEPYLDAVKAQEQAWADETAAQIARHEQMLWAGDWLLALLFLVAIAISIGALVLFMRFGREHKPQFADEYWRDVPAPDADPAHIARIWRWNKPDNDDVSTMLLHLENKGLVEIEPDTIEKKGLFGPRERKTYRITRLDNATAAPSAMDQATLELVFDKISGGRSSITLDAVEQIGKKTPHAFTAHFDRWQSTLDRQMERKDYFEKTGETLKGKMRAASIVLVVVSAFIGPATLLPPLSDIVDLGSDWLLKPIICLLPGALALLGFSPFMTRRSQEAVDIHARCKALKRWFHDFTALDEALPTDTRVWGELLVYASMFGVADKVLNQLRLRMPELFEEHALSTAQGSAGQALHSPHLYDTVLASGAFSASIAAAMRAANIANIKDGVGDVLDSLTSSSGSGGGSSWSSGGSGGGGSFSSGGGGGHGGGGGSFAR